MAISLALPPFVSYNCAVVLCCFRCAVALSQLGNLLNQLMWAPITGHRHIGCKLPYRVQAPTSGRDCSPRPGCLVLALWVWHHYVL